MPEYIYLLETRLSAAQKHALTQVRDAAREAGLTVFLSGGAVRDLTTGSSVRDLDFSVQGNVLQLEKAIEARGGTIWGRHEASRTLFAWFPGSVRVEITSTRSETFPKPGKPVYAWSSIVDDLHRRDFTANAMAISLNEGSYGLLLDPMNGTADIDARQLRLISNYGFIEDPARLVRAVRLAHRLGWQMEERTAQRYENAKEADNFDAISPFLRGYELEKIACEDEGLATLKALEAEGWMQKLFPGWTSASADTAALQDLHRNRIQLLMQGVSPDLAAAHLELLTAKMSTSERKQLKETLVRPGLVAQWEGLEAASKEFARLLVSKEASTPSATWKLFHSHPAEPILWLAHSKKTPAVEIKFKNFFTVWPEIAKKVPVATMLEMRITPELPIYEELLRELFLQQIDQNLETDELMRAFLEKYSPPAPPPPISLKRSRAKKADAKGKKKAARDSDDDEDDDDLPPRRSSEDDDEDEDDDDPVAADLPGLDDDDDKDDDDAEDEDEGEPVRVAKPVSADKGKKLAPKEAPAPLEAKQAAPAEAKSAAAKPSAAPAAKKKADEPAVAPVVKKSNSTPTPVPPSKSASRASAEKPAAEKPKRSSVTSSKTTTSAPPVAKSAPKAVSAPAKKAEEAAKPQAKQVPAKKVVAAPPAKTAKPVAAKAAPVAKKASKPAGKAVKK
jgi:tRNA nucleotidyltransferase (CCA-adding enzyme)